MPWSKRGLLLPAPVGGPWASHAALPAAGPVRGDRFDLYFSPRDEHGRGHVAVVEVRAADDGLTVVGEPRTVLSPGRLGAFDDSGTTMACVVADGSRLLLYYTGWALGRTVPFYFYIGLAISEDGGETFTRVSEAPVVGRSSADPFLTASPCVVREGARWRMWYVSCLEWVAGEDGPTHRYHVRYAESADGLEWARDGRAALDFADPSEYAIARPCVVGDTQAGYELWSCARGSAYRLARADSADGREWTRVAAPPELAPSKQGWDAEMVAYPWIVELGGARHVLYNGNGYGRSGIGYATEVPST